MMKYYLSLFLFLMPALVAAQGIKDTLVINDLVESWTLGLTEASDDAADIRVFNKYKSLFSTDAIIQDDINGSFAPAVYRDGEPYKTSPSTVEVYAHDIALQFKNLKITVNGPIIYNYDSLSSDSVINVSISRTIYGEKYRQYVIKNIDSLVAHIVQNRIEQDNIEEVDAEKVSVAIRNLLNDRDNRTYNFQASNTLIVRMTVSNNQARINSISLDPGTKVENAICLNDDDRDGVINEEDECPGQMGDFTADGCLDNDLDGIGDAEDKCDFIYGVAGNSGCPPDYFLSNVNVTAWIGAHLNDAGLNMPSLDLLGYNETDVLQSSEGKLESPGLIFSPVFGADIAWYFGKKKKRAGIALGISYTGFSADYRVTEDAIYTFKANDGQDDYRRRVTLQEGSTETIDYKIINVPLLFRYRDMFGKKKTDKESFKWSWEFSIGPSYIAFNNSAKYNANIDIEGIYQVDTITQDAVTYYDYYNESSTWNILLTANAINEQDSVPGANAVFDLLNNNGYDFATGKNYTGETSNADRNGFALNAMFDVAYKLDDKGKLALKFGAAGCIAPLSDESSGYQLVDTTTDPYNPLYNSKAKSVYYSFGIHGGLVFNF